MSSVLKHMFKRAKASFYFRVKDYKAAEELGIDVASEEVHDTARKMMKQGKKGTLKPTTKTFDLMTYISNEGEGQLQIMLKPIVDLCRTYDVKMSYKVEEGPKKSGMELPPHILSVSFTQISDLSEDLSLRNRSRRLVLVHSR